MESGQNGELNYPEVSSSSLEVCGLQDGGTEHLDARYDAMGQILTWNVGQYLTFAKTRKRPKGK